MSSSAGSPPAPSGGPKHFVMWARLREGGLGMPDIETHGQQQRSPLPRALHNSKHHHGCRRDSTDAETVGGAKSCGRAAQAPVKWVASSSAFCFPMGTSDAIASELRGGGGGGACPTRSGPARRHPFCCQKILKLVAFTPFLRRAQCDPLGQAAKPRPKGCGPLPLPRGQANPSPYPPIPISPYPLISPHIPPSPHPHVPLSPYPSYPPIPPSPCPLVPLSLISPHPPIPMSPYPHTMVNSLPTIRQGPLRLLNHFLRAGWCPSPGYKCGCCRCCRCLLFLKYRTVQEVEWGYLTAKLHTHVVLGMTDQSSVKGQGCSVPYLPHDFTGAKTTIAAAGAGTNCKLCPAILQRKWTYTEWLIPLRGGEACRLDKDSAVESAAESCFSLGGVFALMNTASSIQRQWLPYNSRERSDTQFKPHPEHKPPSALQQLLIKQGPS